MEKKILRERRRRFAAFLMVLVMMLEIIPVAVLAEAVAQDTTDQPHWEWYLDGGEYHGRYYYFDDTGSGLKPKDADEQKKTLEEATCKHVKRYRYDASVTIDNTKIVAEPYYENIGTDLGPHDWEATESSWLWASDYSSAKVDLVCKNDSSHTKPGVETTTISSEVAKPAACGINKLVNYKATVTYEGQSFTGKKENVEVPNTALEHSWGEWQCVDANEHTRYCTICKTACQTATHGYINGVCSACGKACEHTGGTATCTKKAVCTVCGQEYGTVNANNHTLVLTKANDETCTATGNSAYWTCSECGNTYSDEEGKTVAGKDSWVIPAKGHDWEVSEWHWAEDYKTATVDLVCKNDKTHTVEGVKATIDDSEIVKEATCEDDQVVTYTATATYDGKTFESKKENIKVPGTATDHTWGEWIAQEDGTHKRTCKNCPKTETEKHVWEDWRSINPYEHQHNCKICGEAFEAEAHNYVDGVCTVCGRVCEHTGGTATCTKKAVCTICGMEYGEIDANNHKLAPTEAKDETCTEAGNKAYWTCSECQKTFSDAEGKTVAEKDSWVVAAKGHNWEASKWNWAEDYKTATVDLVCKNDKTHTVEGVKATVDDGKIVTEATCEDNRVVTYTATATYDGKPFEDKKENIPIAGTATGHDWKAVKWTWAEDYSSATVELVCQNNEEHKKTITVTPEPKTVKAETCGANRIVTYTATAEYEGKTFTDTKENIEVAGTATGKHQLTAFEKKDPTCTEAGNTAYWYCPECGKYFGDAEGTQEIEKDSWILPVIDEHAWTFTEITWAESTEGGYAATAHFKCDNSETHTTEAKMTVSSETTKATCQAAGKTVYTASLAATDSPDKKEHKDEKTVTIDMKAHTPGEARKENETAPTCESGGSYNEVIYCTACNTLLSRKTVTTEKLGHDWGEWTVIQQPTTEQEGVKVRACSRCTATEQAPIPRLEPTSGGEGDGTGGDKTGTEGEETGNEGDNNNGGTTPPEEVLNKINVVVVPNGGISYVGGKINASQIGGQKGKASEKVNAVKITLNKKAARTKANALKGKKLKKVTVKTKSGKKLNVSKLKKAGLSKAEIKKLKKVAAAIGKANTTKELNDLNKKLIQGGFQKKTFKYKKSFVSK